MGKRMYFACLCLVIFLIPGTPIGLVLDTAFGQTFQAAAEAPISWGGAWKGSTEFTFFADETRGRGLGSLQLNARTLTYPWRLFADGHIDLDGPLYSSSGSVATGSDEWKLHADIDRLYGRLYLPAADVSIGKQIVNWGVGYAWDPTDVFNPPDPTDPSGRRPGIVSAVVHVPVGPLDGWHLAAARDKYGLRRRGNLSGTDWSVLAVADRGATVVGADVKGDLGVGWHAAAALRLPQKDVTPLRWQGLVGADYSWLGGKLLWIGELFISSDDPNDAVQTHTFHQLTYRLDEFSSITGSWLADFSTEMYLWNAAVSTALGYETQLMVGLTVYGGKVPPGPFPTPEARLKAELVKAF